MRILRSPNADDLEPKGYHDKEQDEMKILWATKIGDEDWQEQLITENPAAIEKASTWARANGFDRLRVADVDLSKPPDFSKVIRSKAK